MKKIILIFTLIFLPFCIYAQNDNDIVALVNNKPITFYEFQQRKKLIILLNKDKVQKNNLDIEKSISKSAINSLIDEEVLFQYADKINLKTSPKDLDATISVIEERNKFPKNYYEKLLKNNSIDFNTFKTQVKSEIIKNEILSSLYRNTKVTNSEVDEAILFSNSKDAIISAIVFTSKDNDDSTLLKMRNFRKKLKNCVNIKESTYNQFADKEEIHSKLSTLDLQLHTILKDLKLNQVSNLFEGQKNFKMSILCDKRIDNISVEENNYINNILANKKMSQKAIKFLQNLRSRAYVKIMLKG